MNRFKSLVSLSLIGLAVLMAGCPKKPARPNPSDTMSKLGDGSMVDSKPIDGSASELENKNLTPGSHDEANLDRAALAGNVVYFDFDRSAIKQGERKKLQEAAKWLAAPENKGKRLLLEGHCDWRGTEEYNLGLGDRRANEVKNYLKSLGVDEARLETVSKGDLGSKEKAAEAEMAKDRRVELVVFKN